MKAELEKLIALQNLDTSIRKLEKDLEAIPERRAQIEGEFDRRAFEIRALESRRDEAKHCSDRANSFNHIDLRRCHFRRRTSNHCPAAGKQNGRRDRGR